MSIATDVLMECCCFCLRN